MTGDSSASNRFRLRTFGTLTLAGPDDVPVLGQHGHHRRRLALLALLAAAGDRGWSRDQLLLFFWPDATQSRARHSLEQLLYALRISIGEDLFAASNPVVLNPALITSDVAEFSAALERGQPEQAVKQYRGAFLDGFYLDDAPEFERWVEEERGRLKSRYTSALERLAETADAAKDRLAAVHWWRALVESEPVSTRSAAGLIRSLMQAGDYAAALQFAEHYEALVARELGTSVGPAVAKLVAEARAAAGARRIAQPKMPFALASSRELTAQSSIVATTPPPALVSRRRVSLGAVTLAGAVLLTAALIATNETRVPAPPATSVAVIPFANVGCDSADAVIVDGLSEEMITALSRIRELRVTGRQSSFAFRGSTLSASRIGDSLHVMNLLEGSIQCRGDRLHVQVRLVGTPDGVTRWSDTFDPSMSDIFAMQSDIAAAVARELDLQLATGAAQRIRRGPTQNIAAWDLYVRGRDPVHMRSASGVAEGLRMLEQAVALDSTFAAAYAAMPYMYFVQHGGAQDTVATHELERRAEGAARKALALDPNLPEAHVGLAVALTPAYKHMAATETALRRAIALGGGPRVREHLSRVLLWSGHHRESFDEAIRAAAEDPLSPTAAADVGEGLCVNGRPEEGLQQLEKLRAVRPPLPRIDGYSAICHAMKEDWRAAIGDLGDGEGYNPWSVLLGYFVARSGDLEQARRLEARAIERWRTTGRGAIRVAVIAAATGDRDKAFAWLDRTGNDGLSAAAIMYPFFRDLHNDPRFQRFRERIGLK